MLRQNVLESWKNPDATGIPTDPQKTRVLARVKTDPRLGVVIPATGPRLTREVISPALR